MGFFKRLFCKHEHLEFERNIYGDEINQANGNRSWWGCVRCGKGILKPDLYICKNCESWDFQDNDDDHKSCAYRVPNKRESSDICCEYRKKEYKEDLSGLDFLWQAWWEGPDVLMESSISPILFPNRRDAIEYAKAKIKGSMYDDLGFGANAMRIPIEDERDKDDD